MVQQTNNQEEVAELTDKIKELSHLIEDLLQRDVERERLLTNCSQMIEALQKGLPQEKKSPIQQQEGLGNSIHATGAGSTSQI